MPPIPKIQKPQTCNLAVDLLRVQGWGLLRFFHDESVIYDGGSVFDTDMICPPPTEEDGVGVGWGLSALRAVHLGSVRRH